MGLQMASLCCNFKSSIWFHAAWSASPKYADAAAEEIVGNAADAWIGGAIP